MKTRSIAGLMLVVASVGLGIAAMSRPTRLWGAILFSSATAILLGAVVAALMGRGRRRGFWTGFAIFGWGYLTLQYGPWFETQVGPYTFPTALLDVLYPVVSSPAASPPAPPVVTSTFVPTMTPYVVGANVVVPPPPPAPVSVATSSATLVLPLNRWSPPSPWVAWTQIDTLQGWPGTSTPAAFHRVGHSLLSLLAALAGGMIALRVAGRDAVSAPENSLPPTE